jgi:uncharacterized protein YneF (UPF0154 family)
MNALLKLVATLAGLVLGVVIGIFTAGLYVQVTYSCQPSPLDPCDAGAYVGMGIAIFLAPVFGVTLGVLGYWLAARYVRRRAA